MNLKVFDAKNRISEKEFDEFSELLNEAFPPEERRSREDFLKLCMFQDKYKIYALFEQSRMVAFFTVWEFESFTFGDYFAVSKALRSRGIGKRLLGEVLKCSVQPFVLEVEMPQTELAVRRLNFYERNGFVKNPQPYMLPAMQAGFEPIPMHILSYPKQLENDRFAVLVKEIYKTIYGVKNK